MSPVPASVITIADGESARPPEDRVMMMFFLALLVVGFVYEWMKGALEWE